MHNIVALFDRKFRQQFGLDRYSSLFSEEQHPRDDGGRFALKSEYKPTSGSLPKAQQPQVKAPIKFGFDARPAGTVSPMDFAVKKQAQSLSGQKSLLEMFDEAFEPHLAPPKKERQNSLFRRWGLLDRYAASEGKWITIGAGEGHKGTHVQVSKSGDIVKGPKSLKGENLSSLPPRDQSGDAPFSLRREKAELWHKHKPKSTEQKKLFSGDGPAPPTEEQHPNRPKPRKSDGRIVGPGLAKVGEMKVDPVQFQYKMHTDNPAGVTDQFSDIDYNPELAGTIHVWHNPEDNQTYVVNGHHRHELARRSGYQGDVQVHYLDAADASEARAKGAIINIAGGNGTAIDAAKFMRDTGRGLEDMKQAGVSVKGAIARDAAILSGLSDSLFQSVAQGDFRLGRALAIAKHLKDHDQQNALAKRVSRYEEANNKELSDTTVEDMAEDLTHAPKVKNDKSGVLWEDAIEDERSVDVEKSQLRGALRRELTGKLNAFKAVATDKKADVLSEHNTINAEKNREQAESLSRLLADFNRESRYRGPVGDLLNNAAVELANAPSKLKPILNKLRDDVLGMLAADVQKNDSGGISEDGEIGDDGVSRYKPAPGQKGFFGRRFWEVKDFYSTVRSLPGIQRTELSRQFSVTMERHFQLRKR